MTAEAQRIAQRIGNFLGIILLAVVQIQFLIRGLIADRRMNIALLDLLYAGDRLNGSCSTQQMSDHGLCGIDLQILCMLTEYELDRAGLKQIVVMGRRTMALI